MEWLESTADGDHAQGPADEAFAVIREVPAQLTSRVRAITSADSQQAIVTQEADLLAFPALFEGETKEQRLGRLEAFERNWEWLAKQFKTVIDAANGETFKQLAEFAFKQHSVAEDASRQRTIPTAVCVAGSINPADHAQTFPCLVEELRNQGCYAALLTQRELPGGTSVAPALRSLLRQFSGLDTEADDMLALAAWHEDELGREAKACRSKPAAAASDASAAVLSPLGKLGLNTPQKGANLCPGNKNEALESPFGKLALQTPQNKRPKRGCTLSPADKPAEQQVDEGVPPASSRPLVAVIEGVEGVDPGTLRDLLTVLSESRGKLPVTLVLGMSTSGSALGQILAGAGTDVLAPSSFRLPGSLSLLESLFSQVFASPECRLLFGHGLLRALDDHFMHHDFTVRSFQQGLKVACMVHAQQNALSHLAGVPPERLAGECGRVPRHVRQTAAAVTHALSAAHAWKLALRCVNAAALALGHRAVSDGFSVRELYRDAAAPGFLRAERARSLLRTLKSGVEDLAIDEARALASSMLQLVEGNAGGEDMAALAKAALEEGEGQAPKPRAEQQAEVAADATVGAKVAAGAKSRAAGSRRSALAEAVKETRPSGPSGQAPGRHESRPPAVEKLCELLELLFETLDAPPHDLPGALPFCIKDERRGRRQLSYAPRAVVDTAMTHPELYLGGAALGLSHEQHDTSIAYQLLTEYGEDVDVADWFAGFCTIHGREASEAAPQKPSPPKKAKKAGRRRSASQQEPTATKSTLKQAKLPFIGSGSKKGSQTSPMVELVSRFTQATNELQLLGVVKPAGKRRAGAHARRLMWAPPLGTET